VTVILLIGLGVGRALIGGRSTLRTVVETVSRRRCGPRGRRDRHRDIARVRRVKRGPRHSGRRTLFLPRSNLRVMFRRAAECLQLADIVAKVVLRKVSKILEAAGAIFV
jgi:hypothetical protein